MKIQQLASIILIIFAFACEKSNPVTNEQVSQIEVEIKQLNTFEAKKIYLENILDDDQTIRDDSELVLSKGLDSQEHKEYIKAQWEQDEINLIKIEKYLNTYGYPTKEMGKRATTAPWVVIHHSNVYGVRERNFEIIYEAYLNNHIDENAMSLYLGRMYSIKNGERLQMKSPYKQDDEINVLIQKLNLEDKKIKVQEQVEKNTQNVNV